jgi:hypothetical protein
MPSPTQWAGLAAVAILWAAWTYRCELTALVKTAWAKVSRPKAGPSILFPAALAVAILAGRLTTPHNTLPPIPAPSPDLAAVAKPLAARVDQADRADFAAFFAAAADVLSRDAGANVKTAEALAAVNHAALNLMFQRRGWGSKYNDLAAAIGEAEGRHLGLFDPKTGKNKAGPIDAAQVSKAADFCRAVAWGCQQ